MTITNILENQLNQEETLTLIEAMENDFSDVERVLIKADWVMQNSVQQLQKTDFNDQDRELLITQLNAAISSVQNHLYQGDVKNTCSESSAA